MTESARATAWSALIRIDHEGAYANLLLASVLGQSHLSKEDRAFATDLVYGTTRMRRACDAVIDRFITREPSPEIRSLLRLGAYQLVFAGVPPHAAVGETVSLAPRRVRGFVNAVLRRVATMPTVQWRSRAEELSYPDWIVEIFMAEMDESSAWAALDMMNRPAGVTRRADGYVQDLSSQWVVDAVGARAGDVVLDICAGPGGKATGLAGSGATVVAADVQPQRAGLVLRNARTLGLDVAVVAADGTRPPFRPAAFDRVLLDAPCSGLGALRRRADARWRIQRDDLEHLATLQSLLLERAADLVRPGGVLVYSVCTITRAESIDHATPEGFDILGRSGDGVTPPLPDIWRDFGSGHRILPQDHQPPSNREVDRDDRYIGSDGMVLVRYRRRT